MSSSHFYTPERRQNGGMNKQENARIMSLERAAERRHKYLMPTEKYRQWEKGILFSGRNVFRTDRNLVVSEGPRYACVAEWRESFL